MQSPTPRDTLSAIAKAKGTQFLTTATLWIHATAGALWIGACACFVIAGLALTPGSDEHRNFVVRTAPKIDHLAMFAAALLFLTGLLNLARAASSRQFAFSTAFTTVLAIKILLFIAMLAMMRRAMRIGAELRLVMKYVPQIEEKKRPEALAGILDHSLKTHAAIVAMGSIELLFGLWLIGR